MSGWDDRQPDCEAYFSGEESWMPHPNDPYEGRVSRTEYFKLRTQLEQDCHPQSAHTVKIPYELLRRLVGDGTDFAELRKQNRMLRGFVQDAVEVHPDLDLRPKPIDCKVCGREGVVYPEDMPEILPGLRGHWIPECFDCWKNRIPKI